MGTMVAGLTLDDNEAEALRFYLLDVEAMLVDDVDDREAVVAETDDDFDREELADARNALERTRTKLALLDSDRAAFAEREADTAYEAYDAVESEWRSCSSGDLWPGCGAGENMTALERLIALLGLLRRLELKRAEA